MNKPEISIILPAIRQEKWVGLYESIKKSTKRSFELIICSPYPLPEELQKEKNVKYVKDWGSPVRASNIAAMLCEGKLVTWTADDALFFEGSLDKNIDILYAMGDNPKNVVLCKYYEGDNTEENRQIHLNSGYYKLNIPSYFSPFLSNDWFIFNIGIMYRSFFETLGGWDSRYEGTAMSHNDFAVRAQFLGAKTYLSDIPLFECEHMPGSSGDHAPIFECQHGHDEPLYTNTYRDRNWFNNKHKLELGNDWKTADMHWDRRFNRES